MIAMMGTMAMKVTVIGGTGLVGRKLVSLLRKDGHEAIVAARSTGVNAVTGEGLSEALTGADVVVDVSNPGYAGAADTHDFFVASGITLCAAARLAGVRHYIALSVVGTGRLGSRGYFRAKKAQESLITASSLPFTIVRSTPFFEFLYNIVDADGDGDVIHLPSVLVQPIFSEDVAAILLEIALGSPANAMIEIGGPDIYRLCDLGEEILVANEDTRTIVIDPEAAYFETRIDGEALTVNGHRGLGSMRFEDWLRQSLAVA
jgi:uncharacterized protein YbjT (DUF2867 family)